MTGKLVVARGQWQRTSVLTIADNTYYALGTVAAGFRPEATIYVPVTIQGRTGSGAVNIATTHARIQLDGSVDFLANFPGTMQVNDYVLIGGVTWTTP